MPGLGTPEILILLILALILFGAKRLPEIGKGLGQGIREFKKSASEIKNDIEGSLKDEKKPEA